MKYSKLASDTLADIRDADTLHAVRKPKHVALHHPSEPYGSIVYATYPYELFGQVESGERLVTGPELINLRIKLFELLTDEEPRLEQAAKSILKMGKLQEHEMDVPGRIMNIVMSQAWRYGPLLERITTDTHMIRMPDNEEKDSVFIYHGDPFASEEERMTAMKSEWSDGGMRYPASVIERIRNDATSIPLPHELYLQSRGGMLNAEQFLNHPIVKAAASGNDHELMIRYVRVIQMLSAFNVRGQNHFCTWRPGEMKPGYARDYSFGFGGEEAYPPNNDTIEHRGLKVPKAFKIA